MIDGTAIRKAFYDWVSQFTGLTTLWADQNCPQPLRPYMTLRLQSGLPIGHDFFAPITDAGISKLGGLLQITLQISSFADDSMFICEELLRSLKIETYRMILYNEGITFLNRLAIQNLTGLDDTQFEDRSQMDMLFLIGSQIDDINLGRIETVNIHGKLKIDAQVIKEFDIVAEEN